MQLQASYRIADGFPSEVEVQAKSGSLLGWIRSKIGVVTFPDGRRYAVAVFTHSRERAARRPAIDRAIGAVAALAVGHLRCT
jgi:beta-lactamase class A